MVKKGQRGGGPGGSVDTEDRVMQAFARATAWVEKNRRVALLALIGALAAGAAAYVYVDYQGDVRERAAVRLDEIRMASRTLPPAQLRSELGTYVEQFGSTAHGDEARLLLAEMLLQQDSAAAAMRVLEPAVDLQADPIGYNAGWMMAVAEEQRGNLAEAARWYERLADAAPHDYQRRRARTARARLHTYAGEYAAAEEIYAELAGSEATGTEAEFYGVKLGEVRARAANDVPPPSLPSLEAPTAGTPAAGTPAEPAVPADDATSETEEPGSNDGADGG